MSNEITLKLNCSIIEIEKILKNKGFQLIDKFELEDIYYIKKNIDIMKSIPREVLKSYILIRKIKQYESDKFINYQNIINITYKKKNIAKNGDIINQEKIDCEIKDIEQGEKLLKAIGYKEIMTIKEKDIVYGKEEFNIAVKSLLDGDNLIEIEPVDDNKELDTVKKLKQKIRELDIPIDESDFFVKKAEIKLKKILGG